MLHHGGGEEICSQVLMWKWPFEIPWQCLDRKNHWKSSVKPVPAHVKNVRDISIKFNWVQPGKSPRAFINNAFQTIVLLWTLACFAFLSQCYHVFQVEPDINVLLWTLVALYCLVCLTLYLCQGLVNAKCLELMLHRCVSVFKIGITLHFFYFVHLPLKGYDTPSQEMK